LTGGLVTNVFFSQPTAQAVNADGTFRLDNVSPGEYLVSVNALPPGYYVKEARLDQKDVLDQPMHFSGVVSGPLNVVISPNGGMVDGTLMNEAKKPMPGIQAVLIPSRQLSRIDLYKTAVADEKGYFVFRGITPGTIEYLPGKPSSNLPITIPIFSVSTNKKENSCR
jgi:hypothetical protein